jgi:hypothetical protein
MENPTATLEDLFLKVVRESRREEEAKAAAGGAN